MICTKNGELTIIDDEAENENMLDEAVEEIHDEFVGDIALIEEVFKMYLK